MLPLLSGRCRYPLYWAMLSEQAAYAMLQGARGAVLAAVVVQSSQSSVLPRLLLAHASQRTLAATRGSSVALEQ
eukprot:6106616-Pleurochrysis_carterae.AAC.3